MTVSLSDLLCISPTLPTIACHYTIGLGISQYAHLSKSDWLCVSHKLFELPTGTDATIVINACNHRRCRKSKSCNHRLGHIFSYHYDIVWKSNDAAEAWGQSCNGSLKSRCIPGGLCGLYEWYKAEIYCCAFFAAAMRTKVAAATIGWFPSVKLWKPGMSFPFSSNDKFEMKIACSHQMEFMAVTKRGP